MDVKNRGQYKELDWFGTWWGLLKRPCEWDIEPLVSMSHGVSECFYMFSIFYLELSLCLTNIKLGTIITFKFVDTCFVLFFFWFCVLFVM